MFSIEEFNERDKRKALNNTTELCDLLVRDIASMIIEGRYANMGEVKESIRDHIKLFFKTKYNLNCYFVDQALINIMSKEALRRIYRNERMDFSSGLIDQHNAPVDDILRAEDALVAAVKDLHDKIDTISKRRQKEFHDKKDAKEGELSKAAYEDARAIGIAALEFVGVLALFLGIVGLVLITAFPAATLAAAVAGISSGMVTLSVGTFKLGWAVSTASSAAGVLLIGIGANAGGEIQKAVNMASHTHETVELRPALIRALQDDVGDIIKKSELISLGVVEFTKQKGGMYV